MRKIIHRTGRRVWPALAILLAAASLFAGGGGAEAACVYSISPTNRVHGYGATTGSVSVATSSNNCSWTASRTDLWVTLTSATNGTGTGIVTYILAPNPSSTARTGVVMIATQNFTVAQLGAPCNFSISPTNRMHGSGSATGLVSVAAAGGCAWTVANTNSWISITSGTNGSGNGNVTYTVAANFSLNPRSGSITIAGQIFTVTQSGSSCSYKLSPVTRTNSSKATTGTVSVVTTSICSWTVVNTNDWITILSGATGTGTGTVTYAISPNPSFLDRVGVLQVGAQTFTLTQRGFVCAYSISPTNRVHGFMAATNFVSVTASNGCAWTIVNTNGWITITSPANGAGSGIVNYTVTANPSLLGRTGLVMIADKVLTLVQRGFSCTYAISPTNRVHGFSATTGAVSLATSSNTCAWTITNTNGWITITSPTNGVGDGQVTYTVDFNPSFSARTGSVTIADQVLTLTQLGFFCAYKLSPTNRTHGFAATTGTVAVTASSNTCIWGVSSTNDWITINGATNGAGNGAVSYSVSANFNGTARTGLVMIADQTLTLVQMFPTNGFSLGGITLLGTGQVQLTLAGGPGGVWEIQGSSNLINWLKLADVTNITGRLAFPDLVPTNSAVRFYRAVQP